MTSRFPKWFIVAVILLLFVVQSAAVYWHLFFFIWWLDIPMHILGGMWIALFGLTSYYASPRIIETEKEHSAVFVFVFAVGLTLTIGLFWEIYEFGVDHAVGDSGIGLTDTLMDLVDDLIGALLAGLVFVRGGYNKNKKL